MQVKGPSLTNNHLDFGTHVEGPLLAHIRLSAARTSAEALELISATSAKAPGDVFKAWLAGLVGKWLAKIAQR